MIFIDRRIGSSDLPTHAPLADGVLCELDSADVMFVGNGPTGPISIGVELKTISDLLSSSANGRLQGSDTGQLTRMLDEYDICVLLYYGYYKPGKPDDKGNTSLQVKRQINGQWAWTTHRRCYDKLCNCTTRDEKRIPNKNCNQCQGSGRIPGPPTQYAFLASLIMSIQLAGIWTQHCNTKFECACWLRTLYDKLQRPYDSHKLFKSFNRSTDTPAIFGPRRLPPQIVQCARIATELSPSIGYNRGIEIAQYFNGSIRAMLSATEPQWRQIPGVGKVIARDICNALQR